MSEYTLYLGDCLEYMSGMGDESVDLTVTSPPYDNLRSYDGYTFDSEGIIKELYRVTKQGGVVVWVVGDATINGSETGTSFRQALYFMECGFNLHDTMIYEKNGASFPSNNKYYQVFEFMFIFSKGLPKTINLLKDRKNIWGGSWGKPTRRDVNGKLIEHDKYTNDNNGIRFNIWRYNTGKGYSTEDEYAYEHPAIFPEKLAQDHILSWSNPGDLVFDPMCGSGTTGKMAVKYQRRFVGSDVSSKYIAIAEKRIKQTAAQILLPLETA